MAGGLCPCLDEFDLVELNPLEIEFDDGTIVRHFRDSETARLEIRRPGDQSSEVIAEITKEDAKAANASLQTRGIRSRFAASDSQGEPPRLQPYLDPKLFREVVDAPSRADKSTSPGPRERFSRDQLVVSYITTERIPLGYGRSVGRRPVTQLPSIPDLLHDYSSHEFPNKVLLEQFRATRAREGLSKSPLNAVIGFLEDFAKERPDADYVSDDTAEELVGKIRLAARQRSEFIDKFKKYGLNVVERNDRGESIESIDLDKIDRPLLTLTLELFLSDVSRLEQFENLHDRMEKFEGFVNEALDDSQARFEINVSNTHDGSARRRSRLGFGVRFVSLEPRELALEDPDSQHGFEESRYELFNHLPSGIQQRILLAYRLLFEATPDSLVLIDEPEISFDMNWQSKLADDLIEMARMRQLQLLVATHSPLLLAGSEHMAFPLLDDQEDRVLG